MACSCWFIGGLVGSVIATLFLLYVFPCGLSVWQMAKRVRVRVRGCAFMVYRLGCSLGVRSITRLASLLQTRNIYLLGAHAWDTPLPPTFASSTDIFFVFLEFPVWYSRRTCRGYTLWGLPRQVYCHDRVRFTSCQLKNAGCQIFY